MSLSSSSDPETIFTLHNLPYGIISDKQNPTRRCATVFGTHAIDLGVLFEDGVFDSVIEIQFNVFANIPPSGRRQVRTILKDFLSSLSADGGSPSYPTFVPLVDVENHFPMDTRNFSDFYCSYEHGSNCSAIVGQKLNPSWFVQPSVYNGRTSSLMISGTPVHRPVGVLKANPLDPSSPPVFSPEPQLDYELEMGVFISHPLPRGDRVPIAQAKSHIFGFVLLNDWSARMIQFFEMTPLGPFHGKGSGTSISSWIVPVEALDEVAACARQVEQDPPPMAHLAWPSPDSDGATYDIDVSCKIVRDGKTYQMTDSNLNELYWTPFQMLAHLSCAGEGLATGDIFGTGTISSARKNAEGESSGLACLWEKKLPHKAHLSTAPPDIEKTLLLDGDEVVFEAWCRDKLTGEVLLGFGECRGKVLPARKW